MAKEKKITIEKRLRPIRLAFLIEKDDKRSLREAFRLNTCLWGGLYNPIIPFFKRPPKNWEKHRTRLPSAASILHGYLDTFEPDYLVVKDKALVPDKVFDKERVLLFSEIFDPKRDEPVWYGLDVVDAYADLYDREFKFARRHPIKIITTKATKELSVLSACLFGEFPPAKEADYIEKNYKHCFDPESVSIDKNNILKVFIEKSNHPLRITAANLRTVSQGGWGSERAFFFMDANSWLDLVDFWNLRAVGRHVIPLPKQYADNFIDQCNEIIKKNFIPYRQNNDMMHHTTFICSRGSTMPEMEAFTKKLSAPGKGAISLQHWYPRMWEEWGRDKDYVEPRLIDAETSSEELSDKNGYLSFKTLKPKFAESRIYTGKPRWVNIIRFKGSYWSADFPSVMPAKLSDMDSVLGAHGRNNVWSSREGIVAACEHYDNSLIWDVPTNFKVFDAWFKERGFTYNLSGAGRILSKIIQSVGGLHGPRAFQNEQVIKLLNNMSHNAVETEIGEEGGETPKSKVRAKTESVSKWRDLLAKESGGYKARAENWLKSLTTNKILKCGLNIQCPECAQHTWHSLEDLSERLTCERCLEQFDFPVNRPIPESMWHYRTIGPFSIENYACGGYCAALSVRFFTDNHHSTEVTWTPSFVLKKDGQGDLEADFGIFTSRNIATTTAPTLIFGECKTFGEFTKTDVDRMGQIAEAFPGAVIAFCTLRQSLVDREKKQIAKLARKGRNWLKDERWVNPVVVLTGIELLDDSGPPYCWEKKGEPYKRFAQNYRGYEGIQELCNATQQMHLGIESFYDWHDQQHKKRLARKKTPKKYKGSVLEK